MTTRKPVNRAVFEGSDMIALRLRAARKPLVIDLLEIPPEEIDFEPVLIDPIELSDSDVQPIEPLIVPASEIQPDEDPDPRFGGNAAPELLGRGSVQPLFGVGWVEVKPGPGGA